MRERVTFISLFEEEDMNKIMKYLHKIKEKTCKVPYGKNVDSRVGVDTLPYHFTLYSFPVHLKEKIKEDLMILKIPKIKVKIDSIEIMSKADNSYVLAFHIKDNNNLKSLQQRIYDSYPNPYYHPDQFSFHITIDISKDLEKINRIKKIIEEDFVPFECRIHRFGLYEIYPAKLDTIINVENE